MNVKIELLCDCGNCRMYIVPYEYHSEAHESYVDLSGNINDNQFKADPTPDGMWVECQECNKGYEVI